MKFSLSWLRSHLEGEAPLEAIAEKLSMIGLELEGIEDRAAALAPFTVAYVKEARKHPDADRLSVCIVDTGAEEVQVVCGAPNARSGMKGVFAAAGSYIPGTDMTLKSGVIRGQESTVLRPVRWGKRAEANVAALLSQNPAGGPGGPIW